MRKRNRQSESQATEFYSIDEWRHHYSHECSGNRVSCLQLDSSIDLAGLMYGDLLTIKRIES